MLITASNVFAQAHFETIDGLRYLIDENAKAATLVANPDEKYSGDIVVPEKVTAKDEREYSVVAFGDNCFYNCSNLTNINIPNSVKSLGKQCFLGCESLKMIGIPNSVTALGEGCFSGCSSLYTIIVPSSISVLTSRCFDACFSLTSIAIPSSVTLIGEYCFSNCNSLTNINIPSSVTSLPHHCFLNCYKLIDVTIPSSVTEMGVFCFGNCGSLANITLPESMSYFDSYCFSGCSNLASITIPASIQGIGPDSYSHCTKLESIYFKGKCPLDLIQSDIQTTCVFYVPKEYLQEYKDAIGSKYSYIYAWNGGDGGSDDKPTIQCEVPTIMYAAGKLRFKSSTTGAEYHYTITDSDMANDSYSQDGEVSLSATYKISAYATADGYQPSDKATATLYWINANLENDPSTNINQAKTRGIVATSDGGIVTLSGLDNGEVVSFFSPDGRQIGAAKAENGIASCAVMESGVVIAKVGNNTIKRTSK